MLAIAFGLTAPGAASAPWAVPKVLVFTKTTGFRHASISAAVQAVTTLGTRNGFSVDATEGAGKFTDANLARAPWRVGPRQHLRRAPTASARECARAR